MEDAFDRPQLFTGLLAPGATGLWKHLGVAVAASRCLFLFFPAVTNRLSPVMVRTLAPEPQGSMGTGLNGVFQLPVLGDLQVDWAEAPHLLRCSRDVPRKVPFWNSPFFRKWNYFARHRHKSDFLLLSTAVLSLNLFCLSTWVLAFWRWD